MNEPEEWDGNGGDGDMLGWVAVFIIMELIVAAIVVYYLYQKGTIHF